VLAVVTIPVHLLVLRHPWPGLLVGTHHEADASARQVVRSRPFFFLVLGFTTASVAMFAVMINLVPLLIERGATSTTAAWALGLGGIGQVAGRLGYGALARSTSVRGRTVVIFALAAATSVALGLVPGPVWLLILVAIVAGTARGIATLLQATAVSDRWGTASYGTLSGILSAPVMVATAVAPFVGAVLADPLGGYSKMYLVLGGVAVVAVVLFVGSVPGGSRE
jgi:cyanate permease